VKGEGEGGGRRGRETLGGKVVGWLDGRGRVEWSGVATGPSRMQGWLRDGRFGVGRHGGVSQTSELE
jgi:hypothetical protein